jgi:hypothetical protein
VWVRHVLRTSSMTRIWAPNKHLRSSLCNEAFRGNGYYGFYERGMFLPGALSRCAPTSLILSLRSFVQLELSGVEL